MMKTEPSWAMHSQRPQRHEKCADDCSLAAYCGQSRVHAIAKVLVRVVTTATTTMTRAAMTVWAAATAEKVLEWLVA